MTRAALAIATVCALAGLSAGGLGRASRVGSLRPSPPQHRFAVGIEQLTFVDRTRTIAVPCVPR